MLTLRLVADQSTSRTTAHHAVPSQEVGDDIFVDVVQQSTCSLVVVPSINQELLTGVLVNQGADLETTAGSHVVDGKH